MTAIQYARPQQLNDATKLLASLGAGACVIAGGQELMPTLNARVFEPSVLVDINGLKELKGVEFDGKTLSIGALCVHRELLRNPLVVEHAPLLARALTLIGGGWQVRNRGTLGGNIVSMHSLYDSLPPLLVLGASVTVARDGDVRTVALFDLLKNNTYGLGTDAILTRVVVPIQSPSAGWSYYKLKNTHGAYASATAAALVRLDGDGRLADIRLAVGSVEPLPRDLHSHMAHLKGQPVDPGLLNEVERIAAEVVTNPISDQRGDADYRRAMAGVSARRAVSQAIDQARRRRGCIPERYPMNDNVDEVCQDSVLLNCRINGKLYEELITMPLANCLRDTVGLKGTHTGCLAGNCGACTVLIDGKVAKSCIAFGGHRQQSLRHDDRRPCRRRRDTQSGSGRFSGCERLPVRLLRCRHGPDGSRTVCLRIPTPPKRKFASLYRETCVVVPAIEALLPGSGLPQSA